MSPAASDDDDAAAAAALIFTNLIAIYMQLVNQLTQSALLFGVVMRNRFG